VSAKTQAPVAVNEAATPLAGSGATSPRSYRITSSGQPTPTSAHPVAQTAGSGAGRVAGRSPGAAYNQKGALRTWRGASEPATTRARWARPRAGKIGSASKMARRCRSHASSKATASPATTSLKGPGSDSGRVGVVAVRRSTP
jgi:hypothetical protein